MIQPMWVSVDRNGRAEVRPLDAVHRNPPPTVMPDPFSVGVWMVLTNAPDSSMTWTSSKFLVDHVQFVVGPLKAVRVFARRFKRGYGSHSFLDSFPAGQLHPYRATGRQDRLGHTLADGRTRQGAQRRMCSAP